MLIDFTLRNPLAERYTATRARGDAAATAEDEKEDRYPPRAGLRVRGAAMELFGRHGDGLRSLLAELADRARARERAQGHAPTRWLRKWRARLSAVAVWLEGRAIERSTPPEQRRA